MNSNTPAVRLSLLADAATAAKCSPFSPDTEVNSITADSRQARSGTVFVAVRGVNVDAHKFIPAAAEAGATAIVAEEFPESLPGNPVRIQVPDSSVALGEMASAFYGFPSRHLTLVGVTGTNGKTTIATLLYELARLRGLNAGLLSTVVNKINDTEIASTHTTPDPVELNSLLARMVHCGCTFAAMEVSSHAAAQHRIAGLDFDGAIFTNLTRDHLDYHGTFANYLRAKQSFFDMLKPEAFAVTNLDDRNGPVMLQNTRARRSSYSLRSDADFRGRLIEDRLDGQLLSLNGVEIDFMFSGRFNASNLAAVYAAATLLGWNADGTLPALMSRLVPVAGRFQPFRSPDGVVAIVDYAHTPDALANVLDTILEIRRPSQRIITLCGAGGDRDRGKRPLMAREAINRSDILILTSDNPRSEDPQAIIDDMRQGLTPDELDRTYSIPDRREAITLANRLACPGDIILLAGKGHEDYQVIGTTSIHFSDREEISRLLAARKPL